MIGVRWYGVSASIIFLLLLTKVNHPSFIVHRYFITVVQYDYSQHLPTFLIFFLFLFCSSGATSHVRFVVVFKLVLCVFLCFLSDGSTACIEGEPNVQASHNRRQYHINTRPNWTDVRTDLSHRYSTVKIYKKNFFWSYDPFLYKNRI